MKRKKALSVFLSIAMVISLLPVLAAGAAAADAAPPALAESAAAATAEGVTNQFFVAYTPDAAYKNRFTLTFTYSGDLAGKLEYYYAGDDDAPYGIADVPASGTPTATLTLPADYDSVSVGVRVKASGGDTASAWTSGLNTSNNISPFYRCINIFDDDALQPGGTRPTEYTPSYDDNSDYFSTCPITWVYNSSTAEGTTFAPGADGSAYTAEITLGFKNPDDAAGLAADAFKVQYADSTAYDPDTHVVTAAFSNYVTDGNSLMAYRYGLDDDASVFRTFDVQGYFADAWKQVTFDDGGFETYLKTADGTSISVPATGASQAIGDTGLTAAVSCSLPAAYDGRIVAVNYTVHNTGSDSETYSLGSGADIQIGKDDSAAIAPFSDGSGFKMASSDSHDENADGEYAQLNFFCRSTRGVTDVDSVWYGPYNSGVDSWCSPRDASGHHNVFRGLSELTPLVGEDATMSYCWNSRSIDAGETQTYTVFFGIGGAGSENVVSGLFDNLTSPTGTVALHQTGDSPKASFQASDITVKADSVTLAENTGYTLSGLNTASPSVTFLAAAGLTSKSVVTIAAAGVNGGKPVALKNTIVPDTTPPEMTGLTVNFTDSTSISIPAGEVTQTMSALTCGTGKTVQNLTVTMSEPVKLDASAVNMQGASGECATMIPSAVKYGTLSLSGPVNGYSSALTITPDSGNGQIGYTGSLWFMVPKDSVEDTSGNKNADTQFRLDVTDSSVTPAANGSAPAGVTPASGAITGTQTFTFSFGSSAGKMKQLSLGFFFGNDWTTGTNWTTGDDWTASDTQNPTDKMVALNLPVSDEGVLDTSALETINTNFKNATDESGLSGTYSANQILLYEALGFTVHQDSLSAVAGHITYAYYSYNAAGTWIVKLDTAKLTCGKLTMLVSVTDDKGAVWGENVSGVNRGADTKAYQYAVNPKIYANGMDISAGGYWKNSDTTSATGSASDYNFHYDAAADTLYLNNADITRCSKLDNSFQGNCYETSGSSGMYGIYANCVNLDIVLTGTNTVTPTDAVNDFSPDHSPDHFTGGVCVQNGDLTISGSGTLTVAKTDSAVFVTGIAVNQNGNLYLKGGTVNATGYFGAVNAYHGPYASEDNSGVGTPADKGCINLSGGTVNACAVGEAYSFAFACNGNVNITGSTANVTADALFGIYSNDGTINIEKGHNITGDAAHFAPGQTRWSGRFFQGYGCIHVVNGVLTRATANVPVKFIYGDGESDNTTVLCALGDSIALPAGITKDGYTLSWYTGKNGTGTQVTGSTALTAALLSGGSTLTLYAKWTVYTPGESNNTQIIVDGVSYDIGTASSQNGTTTVTPGQAALIQHIESSAQGGKVEIPIALGSGAASGAAGLVLKNVEDMADKGMTLSVQVGNVSYNLPAASVGTSAVMDKLGAKNPSDVNFTVTVTQLSDSDVTVQNGELVLPPVKFTVTASYNGQNAEVSQFSGYVERVIAIPAGTDPAKITTAVVIDANGNERHIPTEVFVGSDGKYYAKINSLTNSVYALVWHPTEFSDVTGHWAKDAVNDMGARMVLNGVGNNCFEPDRDMTRAEFAATVVSALGLAPGTGTGSFSDVASSDWFCGYVETAAEYGLITGYPNGKFGPNDSITREQAMTMIARAMKITKIETSLTADKVLTLLAGYSDGASVSSYADDSIAACVSAGLVSGRPGNTIAPRENITRAEVAVIMERLLQKSNLI